MQSPLGIYIQVPFCQTKCTYCNFHTGVVARDRYAPYAKAVCREIAQSGFSGGWQADTIYLGGGTPSLLDPDELAKILDAVRAAFPSEGDAALEVTLEADPETITPEKATAWLDAGFNRVSLGVQSFQDPELQASGRMHRRTDVVHANRFLREAGFRNISMDLIAGLPHQTHESWEESVGALLGLRPEHISIYMLEIDEGSRLGKESLAGGKRYSAPSIPPEDAMAEFYESACARLGDHGYEHYEISNWGLPAQHSRHNLKYWRREPYLGFGAGAHSFADGKRWANLHDSARYVACIEQGTSPHEQMEDVTAEQALDEEFFLGLRQLAGIDLARIEREYHGSQRERLNSFHAKVEELQRMGLVELLGNQMRLAPDKLTVSNEVFVQLLD
jgi:oxygen-independent coproporphyrinogen-3 oxidase